MTSAAEFGACQARAQSTGAWRSSQKSRWRVSVFRRQLRRVEARGTASGDRFSGFSLRETEEHGKGNQTLRVG